jgi:hypothetical protein
MKTAIHKTIMRRVYYSYALSIATSAALWQGVVLGACIALFGRLTHVAAISHNVSSIPLKDAPAFVFNAFANALAGGELLTVLVSVFIIGASILCMRKAFSVLVSIGRVQTV